MKKLLFFSSVFLILINISANAQDKKVAVVTFYINKEIDVTEFGPAAYVAVKNLNDDPRFNLTPLLKDFHTKFFDNYSKDFPFKLMPETEVLNNEAYKNFEPVGVAKSGIMETTKFLTPIDGYKILIPDLLRRNEKNMIKIFSQTDGIMDVYIHFKLVKIGFGGMGIVKVKATADMLLFNKEGDKVFSITEDENSKNTSALVAGVPVMTLEKIMPMCESALNELMGTLQKDIPKIAKKSNAKL